VRLGHRLGVISDERLEAEKRRRGSADYRAASGVMRDILVTVVNESYEEELGRIGGPVRLLWGAEDTEVPVSVAQSAVGLLARGGAAVELEVLTGVGHHVPLIAPEALATSVGALLSEAAP
ncbi:MAG TPA: alpha/beta hydrolase, partial [Acidimicrobiia bacterium]|nr:alpha/beta hydrolase [Acidimicrobiia bacterium]